MCMPEVFCKRMVGALATEMRLDVERSRVAECVVIVLAQIQPRWRKRMFRIRSILVVVNALCALVAVFPASGFSLARPERYDHAARVAH